MSHLVTRNIHVPVSDGTQMPAFLAVPESKGPVPGIIVIQEIFGVNAHIKEVTKRIAQEGYCALAPEMFHRTAPGFHGTYDDFATGMGHAQAMTPQGLEADLTAAYQWLTNNPHVKSEAIGAVGFCLGGRAAFLANALVPLRAAVSFYGGGLAPALLPRTRDQHGPVLFFWGGKDKHTLPSHVRAVEDAMRENTKPFVTVTFSDADHGFFNDERSAYNPPAARQAWALATAFLKDALLTT